ncbi:oligoribonuclease [Cladorrhinum sp. PSN259]|nr:oligoribonuclease [Cladorrhinum sp. PSN259]
MTTTTTSTRPQEPLVWIDCEMTGLDPDTDSVIEIYCLITDGQLELLDTVGWGTVIHQSKERMDAMDEWCTRVHGGSGLTAAVVSSTVTPEQAADGLLEYIKRYVPDPRAALLAGNSVHADRAFLRKRPYSKVLDHLHYRILDVSSIKEAARRWCPELAAAAPQKKGLHKAKDDILESIEEARYYQTSIFQPPILPV